MAFVGHLGKHELSAAVLGTSLFNVTGLSILIGLCSAMETLCGQVLLLLSFQYVCISISWHTPTLLGPVSTQELC